MTDVSDRRREPKGIPTGGEFAKENSGAADAADLEEAAFERAEREADEYYSSLTDEDLERQWMEESGRTPSPSTPEGRRDPDPDPERGADKESERQRAERTGSHPAPKTPGAPEEGTKPGVDPERDRLWDALVGQHTGPQTRARLARDPRLLTVVGIDGNARPAAVMGSWGKDLEWLGTDGMLHTSPLSENVYADMGGSSYSEYHGYSKRLKDLDGRMPDTTRNALSAKFGRLRRRRVSAEAGLAEWTAADDAAEREALGALATAEEKAWSGRAKPSAGKDGGEAKRHGVPSKPQPRHPRLVRFASTVGKAGAVVLGGFLGIVRRVLAPLGRR